MTVSQLKKELRRVADPAKAKILSRFFKTGVGQYGAGDKFLGVVVPSQRRLAKKFLDLKLVDLQILLNSPFHEERLIALLILVQQYQKSSGQDKKKIFNFYLKNLTRINNWDLVDLSAPNIVGDYLLKRDRKVLSKLAKSQNLWARRVAIISTFTFIRNQSFTETLILAEQVLIKQKDSHDLIHKAVGWMMREVGKRDQKVLENFLDQFANQLPRTTLRYSIEKFAPAKHQHYLVL
jgi:3-methyladenine DNA glycosylase AlkD